MAKTTHVFAIFDESGSMHGKEQEVAQGFNAYVADLKAKGGDFRLSATKFDTQFRPIFKDKPLADVPEMKTVAGGGQVEDATTYQPRGMTALFDAVGKSLTNVPDLTGDDNALVVIFTDGQENSSREWTGPKVKDLVKKLEASNKWAFVYIGEDQDRWAAEASAGAMGLGAHTVASTQSAMRGSTMSSLSGATMDYHSGATAGSAMGSATQSGYDTLTGGKSQPVPAPVPPVATQPKPAPVKNDDPWGAA